MKVQDFHYYEGLMGFWEIGYPGGDGMINKSYSEILELRCDGTFSWNPTPIWVKAGGRWGITGAPETQQHKLHFEERNGGSFRGQWLTVTPSRLGGREELRIHWQRSVYGAVVFADRILVGKWLGTGAGHASHVQN